MNDFKPIDWMRDHYKMGEDFLTCEMLLRTSDEDFRDICGAQAKRNGVTKTPSKVVLGRFRYVLEAFDSVAWEALSVRAVYYRVVSLKGLDKTDKVYEDIQRAVSLMRDYGILDHKYISDGSRSFYALDGYENAESFVQSMAVNYKKNMWQNSNDRLIVVVEKQAMIDVFRPVCAEYGIGLAASKGFNSKTGWYTLMQKYNELFTHEGGELHVLMITDYDTAGLDMIRGGQIAIMQHDMIGKVFIKRVGLTPAQIEDMNLPTRVDKIDKDMRACELDAMTPIQARELLLQEVLPYVDIRAFNVLKTIEAEERAGLAMLRFGT